MLLYTSELFRSSEAIRINCSLPTCSNPRSRSEVTVHSDFGIHYLCKSFFRKAKIQKYFFFLFFSEKQNSKNISVVSRFPFIHKFKNRKNIFLYFSVLTNQIFQKYFVFMKLMVNSFINFSLQQGIGG